MILEQSMHSSAWKVDSPKLALTEFSGVRRFFGALTCFVPWRTYIPSQRSMMPSLRGLLTPREGVGLLPALLLDRGQLPLLQPPSAFGWAGARRRNRVNEKDHRRRVTHVLRWIGSTRQPGSCLEGRSERN